MNPTQLRDALSGHDADPEVVVSRLKSKQRLRRRRQQTLSGLAAVVIVAVGGIAWSSTNGVSGRASETAIGKPDGSSGSGFDACLPLANGFDAAEEGSSSYITARGRLTGRTSIDGYRFHEMVLTDVRTIAGAKVADGAVAWTLVPDRPASPEPGVSEGGPDGPLWGPGGELIGRYAPKAVSRGPIGATIRMVPVVGDDVIMTAFGCWNSFTVGGLPRTPYTGPLTEVPGTGTYLRLARRGFVAVPLQAVKDLAEEVDRNPPPALWEKPGLLAGTASFSW